MKCIHLLSLIFFCAAIGAAELPGFSPVPSEQFRDGGLTIPDLPGCVISFTSKDWGWYHQVNNPKLYLLHNESTHLQISLKLLNGGSDYTDETIKNFISGTRMGLEKSGTIVKSEKSLPVLRTKQVGDVYRFLLEIESQGIRFFMGCNLVSIGNKTLNIIYLNDDGVEPKEISEIIGSIKYKAPEK